MNDTSASVEARMRELLAQRSGSDRVRMTCDIFDLARALVVAKIRVEHPDISATELRVQIFERTYAGDFDAKAHARIVARLRATDA